MKNEQIIEAKVVNEETTMVAVDEKPGFGTKVKKGIKKHGKKLAIGAGAVALGLVAFALGKKSGASSGDCGCDFGDDDFDFGTDDGSDVTEF